MALLSRPAPLPLRQAATATLAALLTACGGAPDTGTTSTASSSAPPTLAATVTASVPASYTVTLIAQNAEVTGKRSLNEKGQVAGGLRINSTTTHAFIFDGTAVRDLGTLGGNSSRATAINSSGQATGSAETTNGTTHAFLYDGTTMKDLGTLGGASSWGGDINDRGQVTGSSTTNQQAEVFGSTFVFNAVFLYDGTTMRNLGTLGGVNASAAAMNASGQIAGWSYTAVNGQPTIDYPDVFLYDGTTMKDLGRLPGGNRAYGEFINDRGQVAGYSFAGDGLRHPFLYDGTAMRDLGSLGGSTIAKDLNANGQVVGYSFLGRAFFYDGTTMRDLGGLGGSAASANAINASAQVVGNANTANGASHAFIWTEGDGMVDLNSRLSGAPAGLVLTDAVAISDSGYILAQSSSGVVLLKPTTPITPPASPVSRFRNPYTGGHFFSSNTSEISYVLANLPAYQMEGTGFYTYLTQVPGSVPVYRLSNNVGFHYFTISESEMRSLVANDPRYKLDGIAYYAFATQVPGTSPVYRFRNTYSGAFFYTTSTRERDYVRANLPAYVYVDISYYTRATP